jgi:uncharacterized membrane protein HdeD (DUF308 family)
VTGKVLQVLGVTVLLAGLFWVKVPAITLTEYVVGFYAMGLGAAIAFLGTQLSRRKAGK